MSLLCWAIYCTILYPHLCYCLSKQ